MPARLQCVFYSNILRVFYVTARPLIRTKTLYQVFLLLCLCYKVSYNYTAGNYRSYRVQRALVAARQDLFPDKSPLQSTDGIGDHSKKRRPLTTRGTSTKIGRASYRQRHLV